MQGQSTPHKRENPHTAGFSVFGTEEGTRTPTAYGHYHLKVACLPIPPPRQNSFNSLVLLEDQIVPYLHLDFQVPEHLLQPLFSESQGLLDLVVLLDSLLQLFV